MKFRSILIELVVVCVFLLGIFLGSYQKKSKEISDALRYTVNYRNEFHPGLSFKIDYPSDYAVVNDEMITSYISSGGMAPPMIILTKELSRVVENYYKYLTENGGDCIFVSDRNFYEFTDFDIEYNNENLSPVHKGYGIRSEKNIDQNGFNMIKQELDFFDESVDSSRYMIVVSVPNEERKLYFSTCGDSNEDDLDFVISTLNTRIKGFVETYGETP
jgi:hypothetical protein